VRPGLEEPCLPWGPSVTSATGAKPAVGNTARGANSPVGRQNSTSLCVRL
jgi:hypothetical protein